MQGAIFDATQYDPTQGSGAGSHPVGKHPARIVGTATKPTSNNDGHYFEVEFETQQGKAASRFNLWNANPQAVEIAHKLLSALCYSVGVYKLDMNNQGAELRGKDLQIDVRKQKDPNPQGYTEVWKFYHLNGEEPRKDGSGQQQQSAPAAFQPQPQAQPAPAWNSQPQSQPAPAPAPAPQSNAAPWQQNSAPPATGGNNAPPWQK